MLEHLVRTGYSGPSIRPACRALFPDKINLNAPQIRAAFSGQIETVALLDRLGYPLSFQVLGAAILGGRVALAQEIWAHVFSERPTSYERQTISRLAGENGCSEVLDFVRDHNVYDSEALMIGACRSNNYDLFRSLYFPRARCELVGEACQSSLPILKWLVEDRGQLVPPDAEVRAAKYNQVEILAWLSARGPIILFDECYRVAVQARATSALLFLQHNGYEPDHNGLLGVAVEFSNLEAAELLVSWGANCASLEARLVMRSSLDVIKWVCAQCPSPSKLVAKIHALSHSSRTDVADWFHSNLPCSEPVAIQPNKRRRTRL